MQRAFDIVVFGATGFTGKYVCAELARNASSEDSPIRWAIAGRSKEKLEVVMSEMKSEIGKQKVGTLIADVADEKSLLDMAKSCRVLVNCVGPYRFYGEAVVKACVEAKTDYLDISGEPHFIEKAWFDFNSKAEANKTIVISACGFDSVPADLGVELTRKEFESDYQVSQIESILDFKAEKGGGIHYTTYECAVHGFSTAHELISLRKLFKIPKLPIIGKKLIKHSLPFIFPATKQIAIPFPGSDASVVKRTQIKLFESGKANPIQYAAYMAIPSYLSLVLMMIFGFIFFVFTRFKLGCSLLLKYPKLFSGGMFSHEGPSKEQVEASSFSITFKALGVSSNSALEMITKLSGPEPGYICTSIFIVHSALYLLKNRKSLAFQGGVLTYSAAFFHTDIFKEFMKRNIKFEVISKKPVKLQRS